MTRDELHAAQKELAGADAETVRAYYLARAPKLSDAKRAALRELLMPSRGE